MSVCDVLHKSDSSALCHFQRVNILLLIWIWSTRHSRPHDR